MSTDSHRPLMRRPAKIVQMPHTGVRKGKWTKWNVPVKVPVKTLEEAIMESADYSTSGMTVVKCIHNDVASALKPIARALGRIKGDRIVDSVRTKLIALCEASQNIQERIFKDKVSSVAQRLARLAAQDCPDKTSDKVHAELVATIQPLAQELERSKNRFIPRIAAKLRQTYELRWYDDGDDSYMATIKVNPRARSLTSRRPTPTRYM